MSDDDAQVDQHVTPEDWDAAVNWWRGTQHRGRWYEQPKIKNRPPRNSFTLPDDVVNHLGGGDPKAAGAVLHGMFGLAPFTDGDPRVIDGDLVKHIGHGSLAAGRKVLERSIARVRRQSRDGVTLHQYTGRQRDNDHGWRVRR